MIHLAHLGVTSDAAAPHHDFAAAERVQQQLQTIPHAQSSHLCPVCLKLSHARDLRRLNFAGIVTQPGAFVGHGKYAP